MIIKLLIIKSFLSDNSNKQCNIAATLLKIQERKTQKETLMQLLNLQIYQVYLSYLYFLKF